ncbi:uncharacterized protein LOC135346552 isoform X1 [Halichondria panicea]|uniref:uncharacterized protein LOC135346552 isoform X1 n=1 Tax=Halichondria panicea TaxID=6063 RepID=UPI00312B3E60
MAARTLSSRQVLYRGKVLTVPTKDTDPSKLTNLDEQDKLQLVLNELPPISDIVAGGDEEDYFENAQQQHDDEDSDGFDLALLVNKYSKNEALSPLPDSPIRSVHLDAAEQLVTRDIAVAHQTKVMKVTKTMDNYAGTFEKPKDITEQDLFSPGTPDQISQFDVTDSLIPQPSPVTPRYSAQKTPVKRLSNGKRKRHVTSSPEPSDSSDSDATEEDDDCVFIDDSEASFIHKEKKPKGKNLFAESQAVEDDDSFLADSPLPPEEPEFLSKKTFDNRVAVEKKHLAKSKRRIDNLFNPKPKSKKRQKEDALKVRPTFRKPKTLNYMGVHYQDYPPTTKMPGKGSSKPKKVPSSEPAKIKLPKKMLTPEFVDDSDAESDPDMPPLPPAFKKPKIVPERKDRMKNKPVSMDDPDYHIFPHNTSYYKTIGMSKERTVWDSNMYTCAIKYISKDGELSKADTIEACRKYGLYTWTGTMTSNYQQKMKPIKLLETIYERIYDIDLTPIKDLISEEGASTDKFMKLDKAMKTKSRMVIDPMNKLVSAMSILGIEYVTEKQAAEAIWY